MNILQKIIESREEDDNGVTTYLNPVSYIKARKEPEAFRDINDIRVDGILLAKFINFFTRSSIKRRSFDMTSDAPLVFEKCIRNKESIFFIGTTDESIIKFINVIKSKYSKLSIAGYRNGYFFNNEREKTLEKIISINPSVVVVGMGTPLQESFSADLVKVGYNGKVYTCGGFLHQTSQSLDFYPNWINKYNLRMFYRIYKEKEFRKRVHLYLAFPFYFFYDLIALNNK